MPNAASPDLQGGICCCRKRTGVCGCGRYVPSRTVKRTVQEAEPSSK